jgi:3-hydroxyacyl-[acyl-carrier-protein] dehydratase
MAKLLHHIIEKLPYTKPFLFVDELISISEKGVEGNYAFKKNEFFYQGHFKENPVTPGVILTECMAQIGLVCLGIYLSEEPDKKVPEGKSIVLTESHVEFFLPVFPNSKVCVLSEKEYFRFGKLKCKVKMLTEDNQLVCKGTLSGMILNNKDEA